MVKEFSKCLLLRLALLVIMHALKLSTPQVNIIQDLRGPLSIRIRITYIHRLNKSIDSPFLMIMKAIININ